MITQKNLLFSTFIGLGIEIIHSTQRKLIGIKGTVVDETKNIITIETVAKGNAKDIKVPKVSSTFRFSTESGHKVDIKGSEIAFRPHERPKKV